MQFRLLKLLLPLLCVGILTSLCRAEAPPEIVAQGKNAAALVEIGGGRSYATAFCIDVNGYFITTAHTLTDRSRITLILHAGDRSPQRLEAKIVRFDSNLDLALLHVKPTRPLSALALGAVDDLVETAGVTAFGYSVRREAIRTESANSTITVTIAHISALHKVKGELDAIQLDSNLKPSDAGGPVLNNMGKVIGVAAGANSEPGVSFAIPVSDVKRFLARAEVDLDQPKVTTTNARLRLPFVIRVETYPTNARGLTVDLNLSSGPNDHRTIRLKPGENQSFTAEASPLPASAGALRLRLTVADSHSKVVCTAPDQFIVVGGKRVLLSTLREIELGSTPIVTLTDKRRREEAVSGLDSVETQVLGASTRQNFSRANDIIIEDMSSPTSSIAYHIVVRQSGRVVGEHNGEVLIEGSHAPRVVSDWVEPIDLLICCYFSNSVKRFNGRTGAFIDDYLSGNGLKGPTAIVSGPDGNLYVTGGESQTIDRFSGRTGQFMDVFVPKVGSVGVNAPNGIAFGLDGNLYVGGFNSRDVKRFNGETGAFMDMFVAPGSGGLNQPGYTMFGPDGNLLVACVAGRSIKRYDGKTGAYLGDFLTLKGNTNPNAFCLGSDGRFYVCCYKSKSIQRFDGKTGSYIDTFIGPEGFNDKEPVGIAFGPDDNLYVSTRGDEVRRFDGSDGHYIDTFLSGSDMRFPQYMMFRQSPVLRQAAR